VELLYIFLIIVGYSILYFIIKAAVRDGTLDAIRSAVKNGIFSQLEIAIKNGNIEALSNASRSNNTNEGDRNSSTSSEK